MLEKVKNRGKETTARRMLESEQGAAMLSIFTEFERSLNQAVKEQHEALGIDTIGDLPSKEDRAEEIRQAILAQINGEFEEYVVKQFSRLENAEEAAQHADLDEDEWQETKEKWAEKYRKQGVEGTIDELARAHVRTRYGVDLEEFYHLVVHWSEGRAGDELERIVTSGVDTAINGIERSTAVIEALDIDESDIEDAEIVVSDP